MADELGLSAGAKGISEGLKTGREAGREIGKNIEDVQKEAVDVAKERENAKIRERREAEFRKERAIFKALEEYKHRKKITDEEYKPSLTTTGVELTEGKHYPVLGSGAAVQEWWR